MNQPQVVRRVLSPARAATRERLLHAAIELATEGGYDAVGVREVAAKAELSAATAYQHVSSKDHLLIDALLSLGERTSANLVSHPLPDELAPADRVSRIFRRIMREVSAKPLLYQALYRAYLTASTASDWIEAMGPDQASWIGAALRGGDHAISDDDANEAANILSCLFQGAMVRVVNGADPDGVFAVLEDAAHRLLRI